MKNIYNYKKGFTLIEVIISIAIISFLSVYIVQLYITSKNLNIMAYDTDNAVLLCKTVIESLSSGEKIGDESKDIYLKNSTKLTEDSVYTIELGEDFHPTDRDFVEPNYIMKISLDLIKSSNFTPDYGLYNVSIDIIKEESYFMKKEKKTIIYSLKVIKGLQLKEGDLTND